MKYETSIFKKEIAVNLVLKSCIFCLKLDDQKRFGRIAESFQETVCQFLVC
jgi:hypothetical protein